MKSLKMKTMIVLGVVWMVLTQAVAQQYDPRYDPLAPKIGVKGGVNFSNLRVDEIADDNVKAGLNLGLFAKLPVTALFAIQPEILYSSKGAKLNYTNFFQGRGEYRFNLNYLELPVLAVFTLGEHFNIHAGPYIGYMTSANIKKIDDGNIEGVENLNEKNFNRFDYGVAAGIGAEFHGFMIGARYNLGLNEVGKTGNLSRELTNDAKNSLGTVYIGYGF